MFIALRYLIFSLLLAAMLRTLAVCTQWELPSQLGTMVLFAPFLGCIAYVGWQPYSRLPGRNLGVLKRWLATLLTSLGLFFVWNAIFQNGDIYSTLIRANAYHWVVFFCLSWIAIRLWTIIPFFFNERFRPDRMQVLDLLIGLTLFAILMASIRSGFATQAMESQTEAMVTPIVRQILYAVWGSLLFAALWGLCGMTCSLKQYRVVLLIIIVFLTAVARMVSPTVNALSERWIMDKETNPLRYVEKPFNTYEYSSNAGFTNFKNGIFQFNRSIIHPSIVDRLVEATMQVGTILMVLYFVTARSVKVDVELQCSSEIDLVNPTVSPQDQT